MRKWKGKRRLNRARAKGKRTTSIVKDLDFCWKGCLPSLLLIIMAFAEPPSQSMGEYD